MENYIKTTNSSTKSFYWVKFHQEIPPSLKILAGKYCVIFFLNPSLSKWKVSSARILPPPMEKSSDISHPA
jgi:hypothetical protein